MRASVWFPAVILLVLLVMVVNGSLECSTGAMIFPWVIGGLCFVLVVGQIVREVRGAQPEAYQEKQGKARFKHWRSYLRIAWLLTILPMLYLLGYFVTIPLFTFVSLKLYGERWPLCLILTSLVGAFFYLFFVVVLNVPLDKGLLFS